MNEGSVSDSDSPRQTSRLHVVTVATRSQGYFEIFKESCKQRRLKLRVVGWGKKWAGWTGRLDWLLEAIDDIPECDVLLIMDAFDTFVLGSESEMLDKFRSFNSPIVASAERKKWMDALSYDVLFNPSRPLTKAAYNRPSAGAYMVTAGHAKSFLLRLRDVTKRRGGDDQVAFIEMSLASQDIVLDHKCLIFQNISPRIIRWHSVWDAYRLKIEDGRLINEEFNTMPCVVHGPGGEDLCPLITRLFPELPCPALTKEWSKIKNKEYNVMIIRHVISRYWFGMMLVIFAVWIMLRHKKR